ncbi:MAG: hypothetical protein AAF389_13060 [Gemmatimonadota bacterium]
MTVRHRRALISTVLGSAALMAFTMLSGKIVAVVAGPAGIGLLSLLRQFRQSSFALSTMSGQTALVQGTASREGEVRADYTATVLQIMLGTTTIVVAGTFLFAPQLAARALPGVADGVVLIRWMTIPVMLGSMQFFVSGLLMADRRMEAYATVQTCAGLTLLVLALPASQLFVSGDARSLVGLLGARSAIALGAGVAFAWGASRLGATIRRALTRKGDAEAGRHFLGFAGTLVVTAFVGTTVVLLLRVWTTAAGGLTSAGFFDAAWTLSVSAPLMLMAAMQGYYLPLLSGTREASAFTDTVRDFLLLALSLGAPAVALSIAAKPGLVTLLFSSEFQGALVALRWMLPGLYLTSLAWVLTVPILAHARMRVFVKYELSWNIGLLGCAWLLNRGGSPEGIGMAYLIVSVGRVLFGLWYVRTVHALRADPALVCSFLVGSVLVLITTMATWASREVHLALVALAAGCMLLAGAAAYDGRFFARLGRRRTAS